MNPLANLVAASSIAGFTAIGIAFVPAMWHPREPPKAPFHWPEQPLAEPSAPPPNVLAAIGDVAIPPEAIKKVPIQIYRAVTEKPKTEPKAEPPPARDYCYPGRKVDYGRHWRCVYANGRHQRHRRRG